MVIATQLASQAVNTNVSLINKFEKKPTMQGPKKEAQTESS